MNLNEKQIRQLIIETLAQRWGSVRGYNLSSVIKLDREYRKTGLQKLIVMLTVLGVAFFALYISAHLLAVICIGIVGFIFWELRKMKYPLDDRWYNFLLRWKVATEHVQSHPKFPQVMNYVLRQQVQTPTEDTLREIIREHTDFPSLFADVDMPFEEKLEEEVVQ